jgi:hypothetical protein
MGSSQRVPTPSGLQLVIEAVSVGVFENAVPAATTSSSTEIGSPSASDARMKQVGLKTSSIEGISPA